MTGSPLKVPQYKQQQREHCAPVEGNLQAMAHLMHVAVSPLSLPRFTTSDADRKFPLDLAATNTFQMVENCLAFLKKKHLDSELGCSVLASERNNPGRVSAGVKSPRLRRDSVAEISISPLENDLQRRCNVTARLGVFACIRQAMAVISSGAQSRLSAYFTPALCQTAAPSPPSRQIIPTPGSRLVCVARWGGGGFSPDVLAGGGLPRKSAGVIHRPTPISFPTLPREADIKQRIMAYRLFTCGAANPLFLKAAQRSAVPALANVRVYAKFANIAKDTSSIPPPPPARFVQRMLLHSLTTYALEHACLAGGGVFLAALFTNDRVTTLTGKSHPLVRALNRAGKCRRKAGFLGGIPFLPALHSGRVTHTPRFALIGSQDLDAKSRPNLFTHSINYHTPLLVRSNWKVPTLFMLPETVSRRRLTMAGHTHLRDLLVAMVRRQKTLRPVLRWSISGALFNIFGPDYQPVDGVSATAVTISLLCLFFHARLSYRADQCFRIDLSRLLLGGNAETSWCVARSGPFVVARDFVYFLAASLSLRLHNHLDASRNHVVDGTGPRGTLPSTSLKLPRHVHRGKAHKQDNKGDDNRLIKCVIASTLKALNWRAAIKAAQIFQLNVLFVDLYQRQRSQTLTRMSWVNVGRDFWKVFGGGGGSNTAELTNYKKPLVLLLLTRACTLIPRITAFRVRVGAGLSVAVGRYRSLYQWLCVWGGGGGGAVVQFVRFTRNQRGVTPVLSIAATTRATRAMINIGRYHLRPSRLIFRPRAYWKTLFRRGIGVRTRRCRMLNCSGNFPALWGGNFRPSETTSQRSVEWRRARPARVKSGTASIDTVKSESDGQDYRTGCVGMIALESSSSRRQPSACLSRDDIRGYTFPRNGNWRVDPPPPPLPAIAETWFPNLLSGSFDFRTHVPADWSDDCNSYWRSDLRFCRTDVTVTLLFIGCYSDFVVSRLSCRFRPNIVTPSLLSTAPMLAVRRLHSIWSLL
ncbi:hypothetical protein PR048_032355 [Dryococelus australis]|uniref:Uncharacterized protein n=1 Tax=Dryococelus australis TaxID=614101 RepID=A0ABQ9G205_9NEOP|nr:hypothetical protein PR048_032355 [Dryococelus australis]